MVCKEDSEVVEVQKEEEYILHTRMILFHY